MSDTIVQSEINGTKRIKAKESKANNENAYTPSSEISFARSMYIYQSSMFLHDAQMSHKYKVI